MKEQNSLLEIIHVTEKLNKSHENNNLLTQTTCFKMIVSTLYLIFLNLSL